MQAAESHAEGVGGIVPVFQADVDDLFISVLQIIRRAGKPSAADVFGETEFRALGCETRVATADGTYGEKGFVTDVLPAEYSYFYACGPLPMLRAVNRASGERPGEFSLEERMGCGFGACMGCSVMTLSGPKRICREGPVLRKEEILWERT